MKTIFTLLLLTTQIIFSSCSDKKIRTMKIKNEELQQQVEMYRRFEVIQRIRADSIMLTASKRADSTAMIVSRLKKELDECHKQMRLK